MYTFKNALKLLLADNELADGWEGSTYCTETNVSMAFRVNEMQGFISCFVFTLVDKGWMRILYNGRELTFTPNDLYIYSPGLPLIVVATSEDFHGLCLIADEYAALDDPIVHNLVRIANLPIVQLHEPKQTLPDNAAQRLSGRMLEMIHYIHSDHIYKAEVLKMLYAIFLLDLQNVQGRTIVDRQIPQRVEEIFIGFVSLLPEHFIQHHDISFYASTLCISPVYLSRVVRQVSGRTVMDYINHMLLMEASFLLRTSKLSIAQISDRLHFADTPSFSKFFSRLKGLSPREFRES